ncbi:MAG: hypothetical protein PHE02_06160 [Lachnospiraceae bacterium]|nr:hypothetical protein [Lachnospiraceae bacterium]
MTEYQIRFLTNLDSIPESGREKADAYLQILVVEDGRIVQSWKIYKNQKFHFKIKLFEV